MQGEHVVSSRWAFLTSFLVTLPESHIEFDIAVGSDTQFVHYDVCQALIPPCFELYGRWVRTMHYMFYSEETAE